jgi:predicted RNA-binding Zn-ribbon protein involved in translation (DUF1610 family)
LKVLIQRNPIFSKCSSCNSVGTLHKSRARGAWEQFVKKFTIFKLYRCKNCGWRGYKSTIILTTESLKTLVIYIALAVVSGFIINFVIKRFIS